MKYIHIFLTFAIIATSICMESCVGCSGDDEEVTPLPNPYDDDEWYDDDLDIPYYSNVVSVPYTERGNLKYVQVLINDRIKKEMIFDTGASYTQITLNEANYLYNENVLTADDILGTEKFGDANGDITESMVVNIKKLELGENLYATNVKAVVVENANAPLLLGQSVLNELPQYTIDNVNHVIKFTLN